MFYFPFSSLVLQLSHNLLITLSSYSQQINKHMKRPEIIFEGQRSDRDCYWQHNVEQKQLMVQYIN